LRGGAFGNHGVALIRRAKAIHTKMRRSPDTGVKHFSTYSALVLRGGSAIWMASQKVLHSLHGAPRLSGSTRASRAEISSC
jgi:hypothetical protein